MCVVAMCAAIILGRKSYFEYFNSIGCVNVSFSWMRFFASLDSKPQPGLISSAFSPFMDLT